MFDHPPSATGAPAEPARFGTYRLLHALSSGPRGTVYEAFDPDLRRRIALRVVPTAAPVRPGLVKRWRAKRRDASVARFEHPNAVAWLARGHVEGASFVATDFVEGVPLPAYLDEVGHLPLLQGLALTVQLLAVLDAAHRRRLVHGAIQPDNLLVNRKGQLKVSGFGWAAGEPGAPVPGRFHDPQYLAPEQGRGAPADARADLYSAALVARLLLGGGGGGTPAVPTAAWPPQLAAVFERALAVQPHARYPDAGALCVALQDAVGAPDWERPADAVPPAPSMQHHRAGATVPEPATRVVKSESLGWTRAEVSVLSGLAPASAAAVPQAAGRATAAAPHRPGEAATPQRVPALATHLSASNKRHRSERRRNLAVATAAALMIIGTVWALREPDPISMAAATVESATVEPVPAPAAVAEPVAPPPVVAAAPSVASPSPSIVAVAPVVAPVEGAPLGAAVQAQPQAAVAAPVARSRADRALPAAQRMATAPRAAPVPDAGSLRQTPGAIRAQPRGPQSSQQARRNQAAGVALQRERASRAGDRQASEPSSATQVMGAQGDARPATRRSGASALVLYDRHVGCQQDVALTREVCKAIRCASAEFARHPVCVQRIAEQRARDAQRELHGGGG